MKWKRPRHFPIYPVEKKAINAIIPSAEKRQAAVIFVKVLTIYLTL
jgi:hypothetical protein